MKTESESKRIETQESAPVEGGPGRMAGYGGRDAEKLEKDLKAKSNGSENEEEE